MTEKKTTDLTDNAQDFVMHTQKWYDNLKSLMRDEMVAQEQSPTIHWFFN